MPEDNIYMLSSGIHGGHGGCSSHGGSNGNGCNGRQRDRKYYHCSGTNRTESYCWVKYSKLDYMHQVMYVRHYHFLFLFQLDI